ncbi:MAG: membrane protein insertion efficiency factor YidD [Planctomyces sp.]|nr:membrane protein insertion efficiency factor YidD [Planctomyces sp.]
MKAFARFLWNLPGEFLIFLVRIYQWTLSPLIGRQCRFQPTCSHYYIGAVRKYGAVRGSWKGLVRIIRCNPWGGSGYDPP